MHKYETKFETFVTEQVHTGTYIFQKLRLEFFS